MSLRLFCPRQSVGRPLCERLTFGEPRARGIGVKSTGTRSKLWNYRSLLMMWGLSGWLWLDLMLERL